MRNKLSICVFIKNNNRGAFCLWESMAVLMPIADEFFVLDVGSTDGTLETLKELATKNKKIRVEQGEFPINPITSLIDAGSFAVLPNQMIPTLKNDLVMYYQADEIWHENLLALTIRHLEDLKDFRGLSFWRYQLQNNFQQIKWFPHIVHRIDYKDRFVFVDDGMNTARVNDAEMCSNYGGGWFIRWGAEYSKGRSEVVDENGNPHIYGTELREITVGKEPYELPTHEMILDISSLGGFLSNIPAKTRFHAPMWRVDDTKVNVGGRFYNMNKWMIKQKSNPEWTHSETQFNIPEIIKPLLGKTIYPGIRPEIFNKIANA